MSERVERADLREFIENKCKCLVCGSSMTMDMYPHEGGVHVVSGGESIGMQWVYGHCNKCGYDSALWKLINRFSG